MITDKEWKIAIIDESILTCTSWDENDPVKTLHNIINWHVDVALDPKVSSDAQNLLDLNFRKLESHGYLPYLVIKTRNTKTLEYQTITIDCYTWDNLIMVVNTMEKKDGEENK